MVKEWLAGGHWPFRLAEVVENMASEATRTNN